VLKILGKDELFHHTDKNTLKKIEDTTPKPLMRN